MNEPAASPKPKVKPMALLEARARHVMLMMGLGFLAIVSGRIIQASLQQRLHDRLISLDSPAVAFVVSTVLDGLWAVLVLPGLVYLCCRFLDLKPLLTSIVAGLVGEVFWIGILGVSPGLDVVFRNVGPLVTQLGVVAAGILISISAGKRAKAVAAKAEAESLERAKARKSEYDAFLQQSAAFADQREANPIAGPAPAPTGEGKTHEGPEKISPS